MSKGKHCIYWLSGLLIVFVNCALLIGIGGLDQLALTKIYEKLEKR